MNNSKSAQGEKTMVQSPLAQLHAVEKRWFAIYTMSKCEKAVARRLSQKGIEAYLPLQHVTRHYTRKVKHLELPLIRGYVFTHINKQDYVGVLDTPDVVNFVKFSKQLVAIPEAEIDILRRVAGDQLETTVSPLSIEIGDEVEIIGGHMTGIRGKLIARENKRELVLELTSIGLALRVSVPEAWIRPLNA
jgi:transcription antitermination factor NusG